MERQPAVAGMFYPGDPRELEATVKELIGPDPGQEKALAVVAPHAGYIYSGAIAGQVYGRIRVPPVAVVLCPNHTGLGTRASIMCGGRWRIPGHVIPVAEKLAERIKELGKLQEDPLAHQREHAAEVHLPFLAQRNPRVAIVPICLAYMPFDRCAEIGRAIASAIGDQAGDTLIVASTDMSHQIPARTAEKLDRLALDCVENLDAEALYATVTENNITMCGFIPTSIAIVAAKELSAVEARLVRYGNSGETTGDYHRVVGYAGLIIR